MIEINIYQLLAIVGFPSLISGIFMLAVQRSVAQKDKKREKKEESRVKCENLLIKGVRASIALGEQTAIIIKKMDPQVNGEMKKALDYAEDSKHELNDFLQNEGVKNIYV